MASHSGPCSNRISLVLDRPSGQEFIVLLLCCVQSVVQFNSAMLAIQRDIDTLTKFAAIGFDGLPVSLQPVLASVEAGNMPKQWYSMQSQAWAIPVPLDYGLQGK